MSEYLVLLLLMINNNFINVCYNFKHRIFLCIAIIIIRLEKQMNKFEVYAERKQYRGQ